MSCGTCFMVLPIPNTVNTSDTLPMVPSRETFTSDDLTLKLHYEHNGYIVVRLTTWRACQDQHMLLEVHHDNIEDVRDRVEHQIPDVQSGCWCVDRIAGAAWNTCQGYIVVRLTTWRACQDQHMLLEVHHDNIEDVRDRVEQLLMDYKCDHHALV
ncbi:uncharacterized protein LOC124138765 [Haliotis rufescens]|uniref:uncharacterized protein LOC124138765 n=1 Tax=Haliotis rufescens TaxID=6454 RepID=UPI00201EFA01|nr:uncharacterized protein LOC124138765 [Haliotis rufescens]